MSPCHVVKTPTRGSRLAMSLDAEIAELAAIVADPSFKAHQVAFFEKSPGAPCRQGAECEQRERMLDLRERR